MLRERIAAAQRERNARQQRLKFFVRAARVLVATVVVVVTAAFFLIRASAIVAVMAEREGRDRRTGGHRERDRAVAAEADATSQATRALAAEAEATKKRDEAIAAEQQATDQRNRAVAAEEQARMDRDKARAAEKAEAALREQEELLRQQKEYEAYIAQIGLVASKIDENAFGYAAQLTRRMSFPIAELGMGPPDASLPAEHADVSLKLGRSTRPATRRTARARADRKLGGARKVWNVATGQPQLHIAARHVRSRSRLLARRSIDRHRQQRRRRRTTRLGRRDRGIAKDVHRSYRRRAERRLLARRQASLTSSYDNTARLWDVETGQQIRVFKGHSWWVWSAAFSPDESHVVTASQDGTSIVWSVRQRGAERRPSPVTPDRSTGPRFRPTGTTWPRPATTSGFSSGALTRCAQSITALCYRPTIAARRQTTWRWPVIARRCAACGSRPTVASS